MTRRQHVLLQNPNGNMWSGMWRVIALQKEH